MKEITVKEACGLLKIHRNTLYRWVDLKKIKARRLGPFHIRVFDYDEIRSLATKLPKFRGRSVAVYTEKDQRKTRRNP